jgi:hypothetical protein
MSAPDFIWAVVGYMKGADVRGEFAAEADVFVPGQKLEPYIRRDPAVIAALPEVQPLVAATLERAAKVADDYSRLQALGRMTGAREIGEAIRALIPTDQAAALQAVKDAVWEEAAQIALAAAADAKDDVGTGWASHSWLMTIGRTFEAEAIRARKDEP